MPHIRLRCFPQPSRTAKLPEPLLRAYWAQPCFHTGSRRTTRMVYRRKRRECERGQPTKIANGARQGRRHEVGIVSGASHGRRRRPDSAPGGAATPSVPQTLRSRTLPTGLCQSDSVNRTLPTRLCQPGTQPSRRPETVVTQPRPMLALVGFGRVPIALDGRFDVFPKLFRRLD